MEKPRAGRDCWEGTTKLGEDGGWRLGHAPSRATHTLALGGCHRGEVMRVEVCDTLVVVGVAADV